MHWDDTQSQKFAVGVNCIKMVETGLHLGPFPGPAREVALSNLSLIVVFLGLTFRALLATKKVYAFQKFYSRRNTYLISLHTLLAF